MRTVGGLTIDPVVVTRGKTTVNSIYSSYGHASGEVEGMDYLMEALDVIAKTDTDAVAFSTVISVPEEIHNRYYDGELIPNPWGSAEAIITHTTTNFYPFTAAHSPETYDKEDLLVFGKLVDARDGAEVISDSLICSTLKGLTRSPRPVPIDKPLPSGCQSISAENVSALVMPETTVGNIPFFACLEQNIPIILVRDNTTQYDITPSALKIPDSANIYYVNSYMEAAGLLLALRHGIAPEATIRPLPSIKPIFL